MTNKLVARAAVTALLGGTLLLSACAQPATDTLDPAPGPTAGAAAASGATADQSAGPAPVPTEGSMRLADGTIIANAKVVPVQVINLSFEDDGIVQELPLKPGDSVSAGQIIGSLDMRGLTLAVEEAQATLAESRASYERLLAGATPDQIAQARAAVDEAQARLAAERLRVNDKDLEAARAALAEARAVQAQLQAGPRSVDIASLQSAVDLARSRLATRIDTLSVEKNQITLQVERAANELRNAQDEYSRIHWENRNASADGSTLDQSEIDAEARALRTVENAEARVAELKLTLEEASKREVTEREAYEAELRTAEARLNAALAPALPSQIAGAAENVARAESDLEDLEGDLRGASLAIIEAQVSEAQAAVNRLTADPLTADLAVAEARVARAEAGLKKAEIALTRAQIRAPFSGTVATITASPGQFVKAGDSVMVLADTSAWQLTTADLNELNVSQIREDDAVTISFYALPGLQLEGKVERIETIGRESGIGTNYTVTVVPDSWDDRLRWNMSAQVRFSASTP